MAKSRPREETINGTSIVELQLYINPRGRSVVNGSVVRSHKIGTFKHELSDEAVRLLEEFILKSPTLFGLEP